MEISQGSVAADQGDMAFPCANALSVVCRYSRDSDNIMARLERHSWRLAKVNIRPRSTTIKDMSCLFVVFIENNNDDNYDYCHGHGGADDNDWCILTKLMD